MMKFEPSISKEEVSSLPICSFPGKITVINNIFSLKRAIAQLKKEKVIGFDTETKPSFAKGVSNKVALIQLSTEKECFLFRLNKIGFPKSLEEFLNNPQILKIGLSLRDDFLALNKRKKISHECFVDLQEIVSEYGIEELSLQKIYAILFKERISKSQRLSNWETQKLSTAQQNYAAIDAWAALKIYKKLKTITN